MAKPHDNAPASLVPRSNKAKRRQLRERRRAARAVPGPVEVEAPAAREALAHARRHTRNPLKTLARLARGELAARDLPTHSWLFAAATLIEDARGSGAACALAAGRLLRQASGLLEADPRVRDVLSAVTRHHAEWVRAPEAFRSKTRNGPRRLRALIAHLFERYPVPAVFEDVWTSGTPRHQAWFVRLGRGESFRRFEDLPFPLTKRMAHLALTAPAHLGVERALRYGWALGLGVRPAVAEGVLGTRLAVHLPAAEEPFWQEVVRFFDRERRLRPYHYGPIVDYLHAQRFVTPAGEAGPPRPRLSMAKREGPALLREVEAWHARLGRIHAIRGLAWAHQSEVRDLAVWETEQGVPAQPAEGGLEFRVMELLNAAELVSEGRAQRHCVATYARSCVTGRISIWSVRRIGRTGPQRLATVELDVRTRTVVQARAAANRIPGRRAWALIERWARENRISISRWIPRG